MAAFSGAIAYLCIADRMPAVRAIACGVAGGVAAMYLGPGINEYLGLTYALGPRAKAAIIFICGVGGIWSLNLIVAVLQAIHARAGNLVTRMLNAVFKPITTPSPDEEGEKK